MRLVALVGAALLGALGCNQITGLSSLEKADCVGAACTAGSGGASAGGSGGTGGGSGGAMGYELVETGVGRHSSCVTMAPDGLVHCWGHHPGDGMASSSNVPVPLDGPALTDIVHGFDHTCGIGAAGEVYCWGNNDFGQLGDGTRRARVKPTLVGGSLPPIARLSTAGFHTCALSSDDPPLSFCWGWNTWGQLGTGDNLDRDVPTPITIADGVIHQGVGVGYTCAVLATGALYCWGLNSDGQLGRNPTMFPTVNTPTVVMGAPLLERIYPSDRHTCGRTLGAKKLTCWGNNDSGQLGDGTTTSRFAAQEVPEISKVAVAYPGMRHTCVLEDTGNTEQPLWCWGANEYGQLSLPVSEAVVAPTQLNTTTTHMAGKASEHICYGTAEAFGCVGLNDSGQLGNGTVESTFTWTPLSF
jgi:alpha-tubulin suppressor-like RCC1 family protein